MSDHRYITFVIEEGKTNPKRNMSQQNRITWSYTKFNLDLFHATMAWECTKEKIDENRQSPQEISERIDEIMKKSCDEEIEMPRLSNKFRKKNTNY